MGLFATHLDDLRGMAQLVNDMLFLARADQGDAAGDLARTSPAHCLKNVGNTCRSKGMNSLTSTATSCGGRCSTSSATRRAMHPRGHLTAEPHGLPADGPEGPLHWRSRASDITFILDHLPDIDDTVPGLQGQLHHDRRTIPSWCRSSTG